MAGSNPIGIDNALFQLRASVSSDPAVSGVEAKKGRDETNPEALEAASRQFESLLLNFMIREMRATVPESSLFPPSMAQDIFTAMLDERYADAMAESGGLGLHRLLVDQLKEAASE